MGTIRTIRTVGESIDWLFVDDECPDDEISVLLFVPTANERIWPGYREDGDFYWACGKPVKEPVVAWCDIPAGPQEMKGTA